MCQEVSLGLLACWQSQPNTMATWNGNLLMEHSLLLHVHLTAVLLFNNITLTANAFLANPFLNPCYSLVSLDFHIYFCLAFVFIVLVLCYMSCLVGKKIRPDFMRLLITCFFN